jgi:hypothetical protein
MKVEFFDDVSGATREGRVTIEHVDGWLDVLDLDAEAREQRRGRVVAADGTLVLFQVVALHRSAREMAKAKHVADVLTPPPPAVTDSGIVVPEELMRDVPEPVYDDPLPDLAGEIKRRVGIISAVRLFGKPQDVIKDNKTEGIKIRCPYTAHNDANPSAWVNTEKNTWYCGVCQVGGDVIDFYAARKHGFKPADFHHGSEFSEMVKELGAEVGLSVVRRNGKLEIEDEEAPLPSPLPDAPGGRGGVAPPGASPLR